METSVEDSSALPLLIEQSNQLADDEMLSLVRELTRAYVLRGDGSDDCIREVLSTASEGARDTLMEFGLDNGWNNTMDVAEQWPVDFPEAASEGRPARIHEMRRPEKD